MSKKILVAEDSSVIQNLAKKILSLQNYQISSVKNGVQVLNKLRTEPFDLVLLDIHMSMMDEIACAKKIRKIPSDIQIITITGNANNYSMNDFKNAGINEYLPKPLNYYTLVKTGKSYIENGN